MSTEVDKSSSLRKYRERSWSPFLAAMTLDRVMMACAFLGSNSSNSVLIQTRLPTLTRTPLPTLTPTASAFGAAAELAEPADPVVQPTPEVVRFNSAAGEVDVVISAVAIPTAPPTLDPTESSEARLDLQPQQTTGLPPISTLTEPSPISPPIATPTNTSLPTNTSAAAPTETPLPAGWVFSNVRVTLDQAGENLLLYGDVLNNTGHETLDFEVCSELVNQEVARYELRA